MKIRVNVLFMIVLVVGIALLSVGCKSHDAVDKGLSEEFRVMEAAIRYMFAGKANSVPGGAQYFFLKVRGSDPDPAFLELFSGNKPPVKPGSLYNYANGIMFTIEDVQKVSDDQYGVFSSYSVAPLSGAGYILSLKYQNRKWIVVNEELVWIF